MRLLKTTKNIKNMNKNIKNILFAIGAILVLALGYIAFGGKLAGADTLIQPVPMLDGSAQVGATTALVKGNVIVNASSDTAEVYFVAQPSNGGSSIVSNKTVVASASGATVSITGILTGLAPATSYTYYMQADFRGQNVKSPVATFTTMVAQAGKSDYYACISGSCQWIGLTTAQACNASYSGCSTVPGCNNVCASTNGASGNNTTAGDERTDYYTCNGNTCQWVGVMTKAQCDKLYSVCSATRDCGGVCNSTTGGTGSNSQKRDFYTCSNNACTWAGYMTQAACEQNYGAANCCITSNCDGACSSGSTNGDQSATKYDWYGCNGTCQWLGYMSEASCRSNYGANCYRNISCDNQCSNGSNSNTDTATKRDFYGCQNNSCQWLGQMTQANCNSLYGSANCYTASNCNNTCTSGSVGTDPQTGAPKYNYYGCLSNTCSWLGEMTVARCNELYGSNCYRNNSCDSKCSNSNNGGSTDSATKYDFYGCNGTTCQWLGKMTQANCNSLYGSNCSLNNSCDNRCTTGSNGGNTDTTVKRDFYGCQNNACQWLGYMSLANCQSLYGTNCSASTNCDNRCGSANSTTTTDIFNKYDFYGCIGNNCQWLGNMTFPQCQSLYGYNCSRNNYCDNRCVGSNNGGNTDTTTKYDFYGCVGSQCQWLGNMTQARCNELYGSNCSRTTTCDNRCGSGSNGGGNTDTATKQNWYGCQGDFCQWLGYMTLARCNELYGGNCYASQTCNLQCANDQKFNLYNCSNGSCISAGYMTMAECKAKYGECYKTSNCDNKCVVEQTKRDFYGCIGGQCQWLGYMTLANCQNLYGSANCSLTNSCDNRCSGNTTSTIYNPSIATRGATNINYHTATLNADLTNMGNSEYVVVWFDYGISQSNTRQSIHRTRYATGYFGIEIDDLSEGTTYWYRAVARNINGTLVYGDWMTFTASGTGYNSNRPYVNTLSPTNVDSDSATLRGDLISMGGSNVLNILQTANADENASVWFEWGLDTNYGRSTSRYNRSYVGTFSDDISNLSSGTTYHYRACASNSYGTYCDDDMTFRTTGGSYYGGDQEQDFTTWIWARNLSEGQTKWQKDLVYAKPGDRIAFIVQIKNNTDYFVRDVVVRNYLPTGMYYTGLTKFEDIELDRNMGQGINIGNLSVDQTRTLTFEATVGANYNYGNTELTDTVRSNNSSLSSSDSIVINVAKTRVLGTYTQPSSMSTGLASDFRDFILLPILLAIIALIVFRNQIMAFVATWDKKEYSAQAKLAQRKLMDKISTFRK